MNSSSSLSVPHIFSDGTSARWGVAGKDQEEETLWRGGGQSAVTEPGLSCQLHARGWSRAQRPQTRGGLYTESLISKKKQSGDSTLITQ